MHYYAYNNWSLLNSINDKQKIVSTSGPSQWKLEQIICPLLSSCNICSDERRSMDWSFGANGSSTGNFNPLVAELFCQVEIRLLLEIVGFLCTFLQPCSMQWTDLQTRHDFLTDGSTFLGMSYKKLSMATSHFGSEATKFLRPLACHWATTVVQVHLWTGSGANALKPGDDHVK